MAFEIDTDRELFGKLYLFFKYSKKTDEQKYKYVFNLSIMYPDLITPFYYLGKEFSSFSSIDSKERHLSLAYRQYIKAYEEILKSGYNAHDIEYLNSSILDCMKELININHESPILKEEFEKFINLELSRKEELTEKIRDFDKGKYIIKLLGAYKSTSLASFLDRYALEFFEKSITYDSDKKTISNNPENLICLNYMNKIFESQKTSNTAQACKNEALRIFISANDYAGEINKFSNIKNERSR